MLCPMCGNTCPEGTLICPFCGTVFDTTLIDPGKRYQIEMRYTEVPNERSTDSRLWIVLLSGLFVLITIVSLLLAISTTGEDGTPLSSCEGIGIGDLFSSSGRSEEEGVWVALKDYVYGYSLSHERLVFSPEGIMSGDFGDYGTDYSCSSQYTLENGTLSLTMTVTDLLTGSATTRELSCGCSIVGDVMTVTLPGAVSGTDTSQQLVYVRVAQDAAADEDTIRSGYINGPEMSWDQPASIHGTWLSSTRELGLYNADAIIYRFSAQGTLVVSDAFGNVLEEYGCVYSTRRITLSLDNAGNTVRATYICDFDTSGSHTIMNWKLDSAPIGQYLTGDTLSFEQISASTDTPILEIAAAWGGSASGSIAPPSGAWYITESDSAVYHSAKYVYRFKQDGTFTSGDKISSGTYTYANGWLLLRGNAGSSDKIISAGYICRFDATTMELTLGALVCDDAELAASFAKSMKLRYAGTADKTDAQIADELGLYVADYEVASQILGTWIAQTHYEDGYNSTDYRLEFSSDHKIFMRWNTSSTYSFIYTEGKVYFGTPNAEGYLRGTKVSVTINGNTMTWTQNDGTKDVTTTLIRVTERTGLSDTDLDALY